MEIAMENQAKGTSMRMHPQKFAMWLFIVSIMMMFAAFTSAYVVKQSDGVWLDFEMPSMFFYSSILIVLSSVSMHGAFIATKRENVKMIRLGLVLTFILGAVFIYAQYMAWGELVDQGVYFVGNAAGSFLYVLTGLHAVHLLSAIIFLFIVLYSAIRYKIHSKSLLRMEMCTTYWHFLGGLWLYLYLFLTLNH